MSKFSKLRRVIKAGKGAKLVHGVPVAIRAKEAEFEAAGGRFHRRSDAPKCCCGGLLLSAAERKVQWCDSCLTGEFKQYPAEK